MLRAGDLAGAVEQAERMVGLGAGIVPAGDSALCGLLLALRLLGGAIPGGTRAVWLADWLSAAVTNYASERTTPLAASLLHCAARGQAPAEVAAVLHGVAGEDPVEPAARRLLTAKPAAAAGTPDLAWGIVARLPRRAGAVRILNRMTIPLTGTQYEIEAGDYRATVTELGAGLRTLEHRGTPLVTSYDADQLPPHGAGQLLSPWPNRVDGGRYSFDGAEYHLALSAGPRQRDPRPDPLGAVDADRARPR